MRIKVCPFCRSTKVDLYMGSYFGKLYKCFDCGYVGPLIVEIDIDELKKLAEGVMRKSATENEVGLRREWIRKPPLARKTPRLSAKNPTPLP